MELFFYLLLLIGALATATRRELPTWRFVLTAVAAFAVLSIVVRTSGFDSDIPTYVERMSLSEQRWYYLREPILWYLHRAIFFVVRNETVSLVLSDVLIYAIICSALRNAKAPAYTYLAIVLFVPFVLGMQNVYRQWMASAFLLWAASRAEKSAGQAAVAYLIASLTHNAAAFFLPVVLAPTRWRYVSLIVFIVLLPVALFIGRDTRLASYTGADLGLVFLLLFVWLSVVWWYEHRNDRPARSGAGLLSLAYVAYAVATAVLLLPSSGAERMGLFGLLVCYLVLVRLVEYKYPRIWIRWCFIVGGFLPVLAFSTRAFLL